MRKFTLSAGPPVFLSRHAPHGAVEVVRAGRDDMAVEERRHTREFLGPDRGSARACCGFAEESDVAGARRARSGSLPAPIDSRRRFRRSDAYSRRSISFGTSTTRSFARGVQLELNRGESRPTSRAAFSSRTAALSAGGDYAEIMNKVSALSVLSNAVLVWNTVRIGGIVEELAEAGLANQRDVGDAVKERLEAAVPRRAVELALLNPEALAVGRRRAAVSPHAGELEPVVVVNEGAVGRLERLGTQAPPKPRSTFTEIFAVSHAWFWVGFLRHP